MIESQQVTEWKLIGSRLGIPTGRLDIIENDNNNKAERCCFAMLMYWCDANPRASLETLKEEISKIKLIPTRVNIPVIEQVKSFLFHRYDKARCRKLIKLGLPYKPEQFTSVAYIHHKHSDVTDESVTAVAKVIHNGDIIIDNNNGANTFLQSVQPNDYYSSCTKDTNILEFLHTIDSIPKRKPFLVLIEGSPGIGKTSICKEIAYQWSKDDKTDLTFFICLHETATQNIISFETLFEYICPGKQSTQLSNVSDYLATGADKRVLVIIDAYEELCNNVHRNSKMFIDNIIKRDIIQFQKCDLVISARCAAAVIDLSEHENWHRVELLGFTEEQQQQYLECNAERDVVKLTNYLNAKPVVKSLCFHPLFINMIVFLYNHLEHLPNFQTELIDKFTCIMILWVLRQPHLDILDITLSVLLQDLPKIYQVAFHKICDFAFNTLKEEVVKKEEVVIFQSKHFDALETQGYQTSFGFFKIIDSSKRFIFCFPVFQEFLAAFFVTQSDSNLKKLWDETEWHHKYINVWAFYFGLSKRLPRKFKSLLLTSSELFMQTETLSKIIILQNKINCLYLLYCLRELPAEEIYQQAKQKVFKSEKILDLSNCRELTNDSLSIITSFLSCYIVQLWECFRLSNCSLDDDKLDKMLHLFMHKVKYMPKVDTLDLSSNQLTVKSVTGIFKIAYIMNTSKVLLSHNDKIKDEEICKNLVCHIKTLHNLEVVENNKTDFLCHKIDLHDLQSTMTNLYIIRCPLDGEVFASLVTVLKTHETLSLLYLYDNNILYNDLLKLLENSKHLTSVLVFEKSLSDINMDKISSTILTNFALIQVLLVSASKLLAQGAADHQILAALEYNPSIVHLQLNDCHITDEVMSNIAVILNSSSQQWSLLDLSGCKIDNDNASKMICSASDGNCTVDTVKLANNTLTSLFLIVQLIQCLNPSAIDICGNSFAMDDSIASVSMVVAKELFAHDKQLSLTLTCDDDTVLVCNQTAVTGEFDTSKSLTRLFVNKCTVSSEILLNALGNYDALAFLHLAHTKWDGEPLYYLTDFFEKNIIFLIRENVISGETLGYLVSKFDTDVNVSSIISTNDIFIANKCCFNVLKLHLIQKLSQLSSNVNLFYVRNCFLEHEPNIISDYLSELNMVTEIILCNNGLSRNNVCGIILTLKQLQMLKSIFICELQKHLHGIKVARYLLHIIQCSFIMMENKVVIGNQAGLEQLGRCLRLVSPSTTILRFISCHFGNEQYNTLVDVLSRHTTLEEFSLYECNTNDIWTMQLVEALQVKSSLKSLLISCKRVTPLKADSLTNALSIVIGNNPTLEKVSFKFDNLPSYACGKIFKALSNIKHLRYFKFCDGQITTKEAIEQLCKLIANNPLLEVINLGNNKLRSSGIKAIAKAFKNICHLKLLALNGNQINEEAADDIASIIASNVKIEKLLLHNNTLKSEGIHKICQALKCHKNLQVFRISKTDIQEEAADDIAEVVNHNSLLVFDVAHNRLLTKGVMQIAMQLSKITKLLKLSLNDNNITCTKIVAVCIKTVIMNNLMLISLHLDNNNFGVSDVSIIAEAINKLTGLKELTVNNTGFTADDISTMITNNLLLEILDIGDNKLESEGIRNISKVLIKLSHLRVLRLCGNKITDDAASDITEVIGNLPALEKLHLNNNNIGVAGIKSICESLQHKALKLLQLDDLGMIEEVAGDIAAVIDCNPLLEYIYLGNNRLHSNGAKVILNSLKNKKKFKALGLNNNGISEDIVDDVVQFVTSNPELEELLLNNNSIGTTGVISICRCIKDISALRVFNLTNNNISNKATDAFVSVIEPNTALEEISLDDNILFNDNVSSIITRLSNLKSLRINCVMVSENDIYKSVNSFFADSNIKEITLKYRMEEIHFLSSVNTIETVVVIKVNVAESDSHIPVLHSVVMEDGVEIVCTQDDVLVESEVMKLINVKTFKRLMLVFTRMNCFTDQEMNNLVSTFASDRKINSLTISKLNANKYNSDVSGIVIIEEGEMIVMLTDGNLKATGIPKLIHNNIINFKIVYVGSVDNFFNQNINEMVNLIFDMTKLKYFLLRNDCIHVSAMENVFSCLTRTITIKTIRVLNNLNVRNFDFIQNSDELSSQIVDTIDNNQLDQILCALRHKVDLKGLDLCGITINKEIARSLSFLIDETSKIELLNLRNCSLGTSLKYINLQKVATLKWLSLSNNNLTEEEPIRTILGSNIMLEKLSIERNCFQLSAGDKLSIAVTTLKNLKFFEIDENIITREMVLKLTTAFSTAACRTLRIYNHHYQSTEGITVTGSLHNITTLTMLKSFAKIQGVSFLASVLKTGVMFSLWDQNNTLSRTGVIRWLSSYRSITAIKLCNGSRKRLTQEEQDTIVTVIKENVQLEKVLLGSQSTESVIDDFITYHNEHNLKIVPEHHKRVPTSKANNSENGKVRCLSLEFLFKIVFALKDHANLKALNLSVCPNDAITEEIAEQLTVVLANSTKLEALLLEDCYLGNNGLNLIANSLKNIPALKDLDLSNNDITEDSLIVSILEANAGLEKLRLHKNCFHPTAGDRLIVAIVKLKNLRELSIDNYIISRRMAMKLATAFSPTTERILFIYDHDSQAMVRMIIKGPLFGIDILTMSKDLITKSDLSIGCRVMTFSFISETGIVSLIWGECNISTIGVLRFLSSLKRITTLKFLDINDTGVTELEVDTIATVISENKQLQNVLLSTDKLVSVSDSNTFVHQLFPNTKLQVILCALQNITELRTLDLSGNVIAAEQLAIVLANSTKLETLLLEDCSLDNEGVNVIANSLKNITTLKHLGLSNNYITKEVAIVNILNDKVKLEKLYIHKNCLQLSAGGSLSDYVVNLKCLKILSIDHNIINSSMVLKFTNSYFPSNKMALCIYNNDYQTTEVIEFRDSFKDISVLTLRKSYNERGGDLLVTLLLGNESALYWDQSNVLTPTGVIKFLSAFRNITTINVLNFSGSEFTELEMDTIVTVISDNLQLENLRLCVKASNASDSDVVFKGNKQLVSPNQLKKYLWNREMFPCKLLCRLFLALRFNMNLKRLDFSGNVITEELAEQLAIVLANSTKLETLLLEDCSLGNEGVNIIGKSLKNIITLKHLDLSNNNITQYDQIATILEATTGLERLVLVNNQLLTTAGEKLSVAIGDLKYLNELNVDQSIICNNIITAFFTVVDRRLIIHHQDHQGIEVMDIRGPLSSINTLTMCKFSNDVLGDASVRAFILKTGIVLLPWSHCDILSTSRVLRYFSNSKQITTIKLLNKCDSDLTEPEVVTIATVINENIQIKDVWLGSHSVNTIADDFHAHRMSENKIPNHTEQLNPPSKDNTTNKEISNKDLFPNKLLFKILCALQNIIELRTLDLSGNVITEELAEQLAIVLANSTKLETLLLRDCSLGNEGVNVIGKSLKNITTLKHLDLSNNEITKDSIIVSILETNTVLERLHLNQNFLYLTTGDILSDAIINLKNLKELSIDQCILSSKMALKLLSFFANTNGKLFVYNHDYQTTEVLHNEGSLCNINTLTLLKFSIDIPLRTTVLETGAAVLRWRQANSLRATGILKVFSAVNNINTIKLHSFDNELNELEVDTMASIISDNVTLTDVWLGSHSRKVVFDDYDTLTYCKPSYYDDYINDLELPPPKLQLIPSTQLLRILIALRHNVNLNTLDLSGNVITDELAEQLAIVLANSTKLETLLLRDCSLSSAGIHVITKSLKNTTSLKQLSLSWDNITADVESNYLITVIECNVGLEKLFLDGSLQYFICLSTIIKKLINLELLQIDYNVMSTTCELVDFLINSKLKYLILKNHSLQVTGMMKFETYSRNIKSLIVRRTAGEDPASVKASVNESKIIVTWSKNNILVSTGLLKIFSLFKGFTSVSWLNFTLNDYSKQDIDEIMTIMGSCTGIEELVIGGYSTALQNCVLNSLTTCTLTNLRSLDLSCSRMNTDMITKLATFISNCKLLELMLNFCLLTSSQVTEIVNALQTQSDMQSLCLFSNDITNGLGIVVDIAQMLLNNNQTMQKFHIGNNRLKTRDITEILEALKQCHKLNELFMGPYNIFDDISDRCKLETRPNEFVAEIITNNPDLSVLGIACTCVHSDGAEKVVTALKSLSCLKMLDISGNNINEEVADDVATVFTNNPDLAKLSVSGNCLGTAGISKIADALASRGGLEVFDVANTNISSGAAESISKMITNNPQLKSLILGREEVKNIVSNNSESHVFDGVSAVKLSNIFMNIQMVVIKQFAKAKLYLWFFFTYCITVSSSYCRKVFSDNIAINSDLLNFNKLQSQGIEGICKALATIKSLEVLSIENNEVDDEAVDEIAAALASNTGIKQLWIGQNKFTPSGISTILQPLIRTTPNKLEVLDLSHSNLPPMTTLSEMLSNNYNMQQLWLEGNNFSSQCITTIAEKCTNISILSLRDNNISEKVADVLSEALSKNLNLQQLYLGNNDLQDRGVIKITEALNTTEYLLTLDLMNNNISEAAAYALASVITSCSQLDQLYLGDNKLQSTGTIKITRALQQAKCRSTLRVLDLSNNRIGSDETVGDEISRAVGNTETLTVLILDDNAISVDGVWKITRSFQSAEYMMIFSVMRNDVMISEETKDEMRAVMAGQQPDCAMYL